jgi:transposase
MARGYSVDLRERAVGYVLEGGRRDDACRIFNIALRTLNNWLKMHGERDGDLTAKPNGSRPWKLDHEAIVAYVKDNNDSTLQEIADHFDTVVSVIDYVLRKHGITRKKTTLYQERNEEKDRRFWLRSKVSIPEK